jgi:hypothetical protein
MPSSCSMLAGFEFLPLHREEFNVPTVEIKTEVRDLTAPVAGISGPISGLGDQLAERFDLWLEHHASGHQVDFELRVTAEGRFVSTEEQAPHPEHETLSPYQTDDEHLKERVTFLRH